MFGVVYLTENLVNGKKYIGQTTRLDKEYFGSGKAIRRAVKKYGKENFKRTILGEANTKQELDDLEKYFISLFNAVESENFYNFASGGQGGDLGPLVREKISLAVRGEKNGMFGKTHPPEVRKIISESHSGENNFWFGREKPKDMRDKISDSLKQFYKENPERRKTISEQQIERDRNLSAEERARRNKKRSESLNKFWTSPAGEEAREIKREQNSGENNGFFGKKHKVQECPFCKRMFPLHIINRWHGDFCKQNPNRKEPNLGKDKNGQ